FKPQTAAGLSLSFVLRPASPIVTPIALAAAAALALWLFPAARRWWRKAALFVCLFPIAGAAYVARQNIFERLFAPLPDPAHEPASAASFVADDDMVLALNRGGDKVAYPIRQIAYHHVVEDVVGGTPIVITY